MTTANLSFEAGVGCSPVFPASVPRGGVREPVAAQGLFVLFPCSPLYLLEMKGRGRGGAPNAWNTGRPGPLREAGVWGTGGNRSGKSGMFSNH